MNDALTAPDCSPPFLDVPLVVLQIIDQLDVDLFFQHAGVDEPVLYRESQYPVSRDRVDGLAYRCDARVLVRACDYADFSGELLAALNSAIEQLDLSLSDRFELIQCTVSLEIEQSLRMVSCEAFVSKSKRIGQQIAELLDASDMLPSDLYSMVRHDFHTFVHVTNVAGFAVLLAKQLGIRNKQELEKIAVGGLLHDLGKRHIPQKILSKAEPLTPAEWDLIWQHPQRGYEELCGRGDLDFGQLMMVYQHHEHVDGRGYPVGVVGQEMHPWAKLLAVVDVFDALTGVRPYREPASRDEAIQFLSDRAGTQFDKEVVGCWVSAMQEG